MTEKVIDKPSRFILRFASQQTLFGVFTLIDRLKVIAFAVIIENAGYGGLAAAPVAGEIVTAAAALGLIE